MPYSDSLFADFLARSTDKSAAIFRRFDKLAYYNIINLQNKLSKFEDKLNTAEELPEDEIKELRETLKNYRTLELSV